MYRSRPPGHTRDSALGAEDTSTLKGSRSTLFNDRSKLSRELATNLDNLHRTFTTRAHGSIASNCSILDGKRINVISSLLKRWCTNELCCKVDSNEGRRHHDPRSFRWQHSLDQGTRPMASSKPSATCYGPPKNACSYSPPDDEKPSSSSSPDGLIFAAKKPHTVGLLITNWGHHKEIMLQNFLIVGRSVQEHRHYIDTVNRIRRSVCARTKGRNHTFFKDSEYAKDIAH